MKETIGIEALLHRAYYQYRVDRVTPEAVLGMPRFKPSGSLAGAMNALQLGTIVDNSGIAARMLGQQTVAVATPDDMLVLHDHVLALGNWLIEGAETGEPQVWRRDQIAENGWTVEEAATGLWLQRPNAPRGVERWSRLHNPYLSVLVIEHARAGKRPDHGGVLPTFRGRPTEERRRQRAEVMLARAIYATWHASIGLLAAELDSVMDRHHVLAPVSPAAPWEAAKAGDLLGSQAGMAVPEHNSSGAKGLKQQAI